MRTAICVLLLCSSVLAADKKERKLSPAQQKAVEKYDHLPDEWREKAVDAWFAEFKNPHSHKPTLLKNDPPFYPRVLTHDARGNSRILPKAWGQLGMIDSNVPTDPPKVYVFQVISKDRVMLRYGDVFYFVDDIDTSRFSDGTQGYINDVVFVAGSDTYTNRLGTTNTIFVVKPLPKKEKDAATKQAKK